MAYEYTLIDIYYWLRKRIKLIAIVCAIGVLLGLMYSVFFKKPDQTSRVRFNVVITNFEKTLSGEISSINNAHKIAGFYMTHMKSASFTDKVATHMGKLSASTIQSMIEVSQIENTGNLYVTVTSKSASNSLNVAQAIAELAPIEILPMGYVSENFYLKLVSEPQVVKNRISLRSIVLSAIFGAFLAFTLAVMLIVWQESKKGTIRTVDDIRRVVDVRVIGVVYKD
ncbi:MAG TPA: hypothetical protein GX734_00950 [Clostridiaceae bacterium]|nr:hypothetical protein [Clostridiaceae bacterium]